MLEGAGPGVGANLSVPLGNKVDRGALMASEAATTSARLDREAYARALVISNNPGTIVVPGTN